MSNPIVLTDEEREALETGIEQMEFAAYAESRIDRKKYYFDCIRALNNLLARADKQEAHNGKG